MVELDVKIIVYIVLLIILFVLLVMYVRYDEGKYNKIYFFEDFKGHKGGELVYMRDKWSNFHYVIILEDYGLTKNSSYLYLYKVKEFKV